MCEPKHQSHVTFITQDKHESINNLLLFKIFNKVSLSFTSNMSPNNTTILVNYKQR